jgi:hypothetical protein
MNELVQIAPECPVCRAHHTQTFTPDELRERLRQPVVELYCNHFDKNWPAEVEQRETLARMLGALERRSQNKNGNGS